MPRIPSLDLARGFTVFIMPSVHVMMLYSKPSVQHSVLGWAFVFLSEGPGAQLFMLLMGVSFALSSRHSKEYILQRAFYLLVGAYALNFFKFIIPLGLGILPENLLNEFGLQNDHTSVPFFLMLGDILHFAVFALIILLFVYQLKHYQYWAFIFAIAIMLLSPLIWDVKTGFIFVDYILALLGGHPPYVYFPVFPWIVYPLTGLTLGYYLKKFETSRVIKKAGWFGILIIVGSCSFPATITDSPWPSFYRTNGRDTLFHLGIVLVWLSIFHWILLKIPVNPIFKLLSYCSRHITIIYLIQWITICWCLGFTGYLQLNMIQSVGWMIGITTFTLMLTHALNKSNAKAKNI
jgi:hypothetical protein